MKGLIKYLSPFAPDQSGASGVFYGLGGLIVIMDAGGCTGNICGFDEPRWFFEKSAVMSAGLRDMDAILGRDDMLVEKLKDAALRLRSPFAVLIGTPVPAVIGTDYRALTKMAEKRSGIPVISVACSGTALYDEGESEAYLELMKKFAESRDDGPVPGRTGVIGATPLNMSTAFPGKYLEETLCARIFTAESSGETADAGGHSAPSLLCYGAAGGLQAVREAASVGKNLVISPSGLRAAEYLKERFGTPYEIGYPLPEGMCEEAFSGLRGKRVLVIHQQFLAESIRTRLGEYGCTDVTCASFFMMDRDFTRPGDVRFESEEDLSRLVPEGKYDAVVGDIFLKRAVRGYPGDWIHVPHFAVSGECGGIGEGSYD